MRIGVNVPNEILKQIKEVRPKVNVSQVCREALQERVEIAQRAVAQTVEDNVSERVAQLDESTTKPVIEPDWERLALEDAREWVRKVTPEAWNTFVNQSDFFRREGRDESVMISSWASSANVKGPDIRLWENRDWFIEQYDLQFLTGTESNLQEQARKKYGRTWLVYVYEARRLLEKHRKDEYDRIMAERVIALESSPAPELPTQLI